MSGKIRRRADFVIREVAGVPLSFLDDSGNIVKENFAIRFRSYSHDGAERLRKELTDEGAIEPGGIVPYSAIFEKSVTAILDSDGEALTDDAGEPATLTRAFFDGMLPEDLHAIQQAMEADSNPPKPSPESGPSGSKAAASEG
jgi:hypothetical protein